MSHIPSSTLSPLRASSPGLSRLIVRLGLASEEQVTEAEHKKLNTKLIARLAKAGIVDEPAALSAISESLSIPLVDLSYELKQTSVSIAEVFPEIDRTFALEHRCFPILRSDEEVVFALADPLDMETVSRIEFPVDCNVRIRLASEYQIIQAINKHLHDDIEGLDPFGEDDDKISSDGLEVVVASSPEESNVGDVEQASSAPIVKLVNKVLADAARANASDVHIEPSKTKLEIRFRIDGVLSSHLSVPKKLQSYVITRIKLLSGMDIAERRRPQDGRFRIRISESEACDIRASTVPTPAGETLVLRLLRSDLESVSLESLGMSAKLREYLEEALSSRERIVIVTGPTGSGKTTTLYAALNRLRTGENNIITVEDPIEYRIEGITQIQVDEKVGITFAAGLRSILRQDPDIIFVGEIRDLETAEIAFQSAQTGHFVLSTLHTNDASSAVTRLVDLGLESFLLASSLGGVLAQRLVRKLCTECSKEASPEDQQKFEQQYGLRPNSLRVAGSCSACRGSGYSGRTGVYSFLPISKEVREAIRENGGEEAIIKAGEATGMISLGQAGLELVQSGLSSLDEVERVLGRSVLRSLGSDNSLKEFGGSSAESRATDVGGEKSEETKSGFDEEASVLDLVHAYKDLKKNNEPGANRRILFVEDNESFRFSWHKVLESADYIVEDAENGVDALKKLESFSPDLILCDLQMPEMGGEDFLQELQKGEHFKKVPFIILTASDDELNELRLIEAGARDFLSKTVSPPVLLARLKRHLKSS